MISAESIAQSAWREDQMSERFAQRVIKFSRFIKRLRKVL